MSRIPELEIFDRQRAFRFPLARYRSLVPDALRAVLRLRGPGAAVLPALDSVEVSLLGDRAMARVHREFLGLAGPTDVITFPHGEILIGAGEADRNARRFREPRAREGFRYLVHGLLHLQGFDDIDPREAARMHRHQERIVAALWV